MPITKQRDPRLIVKLKKADQIVNNSAVLIDDTELQAPVIAGGLYLCSLILRMNSPAAQDLDYSIQGDAAWACLPYEWVTASPMTIYPRALNTTYTRATDGTDQYTFYTFYLLALTNSGTLKIKWAQHLAAAVDTKMLANSVLTLTRMS